MIKDQDFGKNTVLSCIDDKSSWVQVFSACLGKMIAVQNAFGELAVKGQRWNVDFSKGVISFGSDTYPFQFIGSESTQSNTWLWGWDNVNGFDESLLTAVNKTRETGDQWKLEPLTAAKFELNKVFNGHNLSAVMCILSGGLCYYRCPHQAGAAFVAVSGIPDEVFAPVDISKFASVSMQCLQQFPVDHKIFIQSFLKLNSTGFEWDNNVLTAHFEKDLKMEFEKVDGILRISSMKTV
ncbi:MAG: hypothetical protein Q4F95_16125 [Oscillospiraceae bacterium]|nr:hypothetical protein [Oscillospiraceae bacterium]